MRRSTLLTVCWALAIGASLSTISCKGERPDGSSGQARQPLSLDGDSDSLLAGLSPVLATGTFVYSQHFIDPDTHAPVPLEPLDISLSQAGPDELLFTRGGKAASVDARGMFLGSSDPMVAYPFASSIHLPAGSAARGMPWAMDGEPYTQAELQLADQSDALATSNVTFNYSLGAKSVGSDAVLYALKRDVYTYVVPTQKTLAIAPLFEAGGFVAFSPGMHEQVGTVYDYFVVHSGDQRAIKLGEAFLQFGRFTAPPASFGDVLSGAYESPSIALVSVLDPSASSLPSDMVQSVQAALAALPVDVTLWFDDTLPDGAITAVHTPYVNACTCDDDSCDGSGGGGGAGGSGAGGGGGEGGALVTTTSVVADGGGGPGGGGPGGGGQGGALLTNTTATSIDGAGGGGADSSGGTGGLDHQATPH